MPTKNKGRPQMRQSREWYRINNSGGTTAELYIYDEIGYWGTTAAGLVAELSQLQGVTQIDVHVNSPGGDVFDGLAIMNCLRAHAASITTYVDGLAASIASVIAMAGDRVVMGPHSQLMIHEASGLCIGDANDMRSMAEMLDFQSDNIAGVYAAKAGGTVESWRAAMVTESWYTAEEAVAAGLADEVAQRPAPAAPGVPMDKAWDLTVFNHAGRDEAPAPVIDPAPEPAADTTEPPAPAPEVEPAAPEDASVEPVGTVETEAPATDAEPTPQDPAPVAPPADDTDPPAAEPADDPAPEEEPADTWAALTANLTNPPAAPTVGDLLAALREALL